MKRALALAAILLAVGCVADAPPPAEPLFRIVSPTNGNTITITIPCCMNPDQNEDWIIVLAPTNIKEVTADGSGCYVHWMAGDRQGGVWVTNRIDDIYRQLYGVKK